MKRVAPRPSRALTALAAATLLLAGVADGAHCPRPVAMPCCPDISIGDMACCPAATCATAPTAATASERTASTTPARPCLLLERLLLTPGPATAGATPTRIERHPPPCILRI